MTPDREAVERMEALAERLFEKSELGECLTLGDEACRLNNLALRALLSRLKEWEEAGKGLGSDSDPRLASLLVEADDIDARADDDEAGHREYYEGKAAGIRYALACFTGPTCEGCGKPATQVDDGLNDLCDECMASGLASLSDGAKPKTGNSGTPSNSIPTLLKGE